MEQKRINIPSLAEKYASTQKCSIMLFPVSYSLQRHQDDMIPPLLLVYRTVLLSVVRKKIRN